MTNASKICKKGEIHELTQNEIFEKWRNDRKSLPFYAFYNSSLGGIIVDPSLMVIPFDDYLVHRGHGVFDTCTLRKGRVYRLKAHLDRFLHCASVARINCVWTREELKSIILHTCAASGQTSASVRYWLSVGGGDFGLSPSGYSPVLYVLVFESSFIPSDSLLREVTLRAKDGVPMKPPVLAKIKSTNYFLNCLLKKEATNRGGMFGLWVDENEHLAESCISGCAIVTKDGVLKTPKFEKILSGVTMKRILEVTEDWVKKGDRHLQDVKQMDIPVEEVYEASEVFLVSGDIFVLPIIELDGRLINGGIPGPISRRLKEFLFAESESDDQEYIDFVNYKNDSLLTRVPQQKKQQKKFSFSSVPSSSSSSREKSLQFSGDGEYHNSDELKWRNSRAEELVTLDESIGMVNEKNRSRERREGGGKLQPGGGGFEKTGEIVRSKL